MSQVQGGWAYLTVRMRVSLYIYTHHSKDSLPSLEP